MNTFLTSIIAVSALIVAIGASEGIEKSQKDIQELTKRIEKLEAKP